MTLHIRIYDELGNDSCFDFFQSGASADIILSRICETNPGLSYKRVSESMDVYSIWYLKETIVGTAETIVDTPTERISAAIVDYCRQADEYTASINNRNKKLQALGIPLARA